MRPNLRKHKYGAKQTLCAWAKHPHPSGLEASVCDLLALRQVAGDIRNLRWQHTHALAYGISWKIDWSFEQGPDWRLTFAEAKGKEDREFKVKFRMFKEGCGSGPIEFWKGTWRRPMLVGVYWPKEKA
jgi:hypothetical protein